MKNKIIKPSLPSPEDIHRTTLSNGITVLARSSFNTPSISMGGYVPAGSIFESDEKLGLADFVASSLMRGTQTRTFDGIYNELESVGASMGFDSGVHNTSFGGRSLVEDFPLLLTLLSESLQAPTFPKNEVETLRAQMLTGLAIRADPPMDLWKRFSPLLGKICRNFIAATSDREAWSLQSWAQSTRRKW